MNEISAQIPDATYYKVCMFGTAFDDNYAGELRSAHFVENELHVIFHFVTRIHKRGDPPKWQVDDKGKVICDYEIIFEGCVVLENNGIDRIKVKSTQGDVVTLSSTKQDIAIVHELIENALEIIRSR
ncbi:MAG: hypothetical protein WCW03_02160 [Candidatus Paceibacterota bacterium]|jgi:hypothetical protein